MTSLTYTRDEVAAARASGLVPRVHGNGFLQLDLEPHRRLHVWGHWDLPRQVQDTSIHNHRFDFRSTVVVGRVFNIVYSTRRTEDEAVATHVAHTPVAREGEDTELVRCHLIYVYPSPGVRLVSEGETYSMHGPLYHETTSDRPSATLMVKSRTLHPSPLVLVPTGREPDNSFDRNSVLPTERLWEIISEVLGG